jgi:phage-related protein
MPEDWKPRPTIGQGVQESRIRNAAGAFRVVFVAKFADAIYVLHCVQKLFSRRHNEPANPIWIWPRADTVTC